jgi:hypothetical protein
LLELLTSLLSFLLTVLWYLPEYLISVPFSIIVRETQITTRAGRKTVYLEHYVLHQVQVCPDLKEKFHNLQTTTTLRSSFALKILNIAEHSVELFSTDSKDKKSRSNICKEGEKNPWFSYSYVVFDVEL